MDQAIEVLLLAFKRPIAFHPILARVGGSINAGIFMSQAFYWQNRTTDPDGWFYKTQEEWEEETTLTRREQETARRKLKKVGILEERKKGQPAKLWYRINLQVLYDKLSSMSECAKLVCRNAPNKNGENRQTSMAESDIHLNTLTSINKTEITAETTEDNNANALFPRTDESVSGNGESVVVEIKNEWKEEDLWLYEFLTGEGPTILSSLDIPLEPKWWDLVSIACAGVDVPFLRVEFALMEKWLIENRRRKPRPGDGTKRFIGGWLQRAHDKERRFPNGRDPRQSNFKT